MLPSVVTSTATVECSSITFFVPTTAASSKGISSSNHGVLTIRSPSSSRYPTASPTVKPTQSTRRTFTALPSSRLIVTASCGINLGSVVIIVFPLPDCGSSSTARFFAYSLSIFGMTQSSMKCFINVDLPVRTGPTTPM